MSTSSKDGGVGARFRLDGKVIAITGGGGFLGPRHAEAIAEAGGVPVLLDIRRAAAEAAAAAISKTGAEALGLGCDITDPAAVRAALATVLARYGRIDGLVNNAANDPKVDTDGAVQNSSRLETFPLALWNADLAVGLTGAFVCAQAFGGEMARRRSGVILNIASDLAVIAPDQRLYRQPGLAPEAQPVKPVTYSVFKAGLLGLNRYLATYWAEAGVRVNALSPGGVHNGQDDAFVARLADLIPLGRMARADEYKAAVVFLLSDASSYMTGANLVMDGGRSTW
ncbi:MAG TPA: SDR family oxidoreductase [Alphaproteobacteria bacterium]|nr:SDR family oxidoreductase [Alphaproteobacteria bacterium]